MPGIIQVSVLGFIGLEVSSTRSKTSTKVSLGKRAYQTLDKGDFSFPLETFRDKLVIALLDAEGNEMSHTEVETRMVAEKGTWDDQFPVGGGHVHLKLQFILSEEDRQRIRARRELVLRKKHQEQLSCNQHKMRRSFSSSDVVRSLCLNGEVSEDSQDGLLQSEAEQAGQMSNAPNFSGNGKSRPKVGEATPHHNPTALNVTDMYKWTSSNTHEPQEFDVHTTEASSRISGETQQPSIDVPSRGICSEGALTSFGSQGSNIAAKTKSSSPKLKEDNTNEPERQTSSARTPSNVRNMISAFENSLSQDVRPQIRAPLAKPQPIRTGRIASPLPTKELQQDPTCIRKRGEQTNVPGETDGVTTSKDIGLLKGINPANSQAEGTSANLKLNESKFMHKEGKVEEKEASSECMMRAFTGEVASASGRMVDDQSSKHQPMNLPLKGNFRKESGNGGLLNASRGEDVQRSSNEKLRSRMASEDERHSLQNSGVWIFPDGTRKLCITTGGKQIRNLMDGFWNMEEESVHSGVDIEERTSQRHRNSKVDRSRNIETPEGPLGKLMRITIMVGFATLVLVTRRRNGDG